MACQKISARLEAKSQNDAMPGRMPERRNLRQPLHSLRIHYHMFRGSRTSKCLGCKFHVFGSEGRYQNPTSFESTGETYKKAPQKHLYWLRNVKSIPSVAS